MRPTISICIPCYESERFIRTTIESALAQTVPALEILISDDNSPDRTGEIIAEYADIPTVRLLRTPQRLTLGEHYRFLLERAAGDFICFLSHDDALMPSFIEIMLGKLEDDVALIAAACVECDSRLVPRRVRGIALPRQTLLAPGGYLHFRRGNGYTISFSLMSREALLQIPWLPPEGDLATDWYWAMMLGLRGKVKFERKPLGYYRLHDSNASHGPNRWRRACKAMLEFLRGKVAVEYAEYIDGHLERLREQIAAWERGEGNASTPSIRLRLKQTAKRLIAVRYRLLPEPILKAEKGISTAIERKRGARPRPETRTVSNKF